MPPLILSRPDPVLDRLPPKNYTTNPSQLSRLNFKKIFLIFFIPILDIGLLVCYYYIVRKSNGQ